jgi:hypothetical protein
VLDVQYRMHPAISTFPSKEFYQGRLKDGEVGELSQDDVCRVHLFFVFHNFLISELLFYISILFLDFIYFFFLSSFVYLCRLYACCWCILLIRHPCIQHPGFVAFNGVWLQCWWACLRRQALYTPFMVHHVFACAVQGVQAQTTRPWHSKQCFGPFALFDLHGKEDVPEGSASIVNR